jgi:ribosomal protein S18 acetylase RimI-like enzyme
MTVFTDRSRDALASAVEANTTELFRALIVALEGGWVADDGDATCFGCEVAFPLFNGVLRAELDESGADRRIDEIAERQREAGKPWLWWTWPGSSPADLPARLEARGMRATATSPGMWVDLDRVEDPGRPEGLEVVPVDTPERVAGWLRVVGPAFELPSDAVYAFVRLAERGAWGDLPMRSWLGVVGERPLAAASLGYAAGVAGVFNVATVQGARRRGHATAVTAHALRCAREGGYRTATLTASALGTGSYRRLGFEEVTSVTAYAP